MCLSQTFSKLRSKTLGHFLMVLLFFTRSSCVLSQAPELNFRHINLEQGLSNSTIECIFQDSRGFIWFGTRDGLNRYDGSTMKVFKEDMQDRFTLSDDYIRHICEDHSQKLWIATNNGLNCFDPLTNRFKRFLHQPKNQNSLSHNAVTYSYEDKKGNLWIATYGGGLNLWDPKNNRFIHFVKKNRVGSLGSNYINCLFEDTKGNFWVGTESGLYLMNRENGSFYLYYNSISKNQQIENNKVRCLQEDLQGHLWIGTESNGIFRLDPKLKSFQHFSNSETVPNSLSNNMIETLMVDSKGNLWVGTVIGGLNLYDPQTHSFFHYQNNLSDPTSLSQMTVSALLEDKDGNLWVGTHRGGANFYSPVAEKFKLYRQGPSPTDLSHSDVKSFAETKDGLLWVGTDGGGLNSFDRSTNKFRHFLYNPRNPNTVGSNEVLDIVPNQSGNLWLGTWGGGLNLLDRKTGHFIRYKHDPSNNYSISSDYVQKVVEEANGDLWIATYYGGLNYFNRKTKRFDRFTEGSNGNHISGNNIVSLEKDKNGNLWVGTDDGGLNFLNITTGAISHYFNQEEKFPDLRVIFFDTKGRLWIGQKGLYLFRPNTNSFELVPAPAGLSQEFIKGILEDDAGILWISTSNGLTQFNPETYSSKKFNSADGLQGLEFEANAFLKTSDGELFFGGVNGFNSFYPATLTGNKIVPPVYITEFQIFNKPILPGDKNSPLKEDISLANEIHLSYQQSALSFTFAALNYTVSENNKYAYMLGNFDKDWIEAGKERKATYTNLPPGTYIFRVKGSNNDGLWNEKATTLKIIISPPFWNTWWFKTWLFFMIIGGTSLILRQRRKAETKRAEDLKKEEMHQMQLQFFTNISHEFRTPLSLIINPLEKLLKSDSSTHSYYKIMYRNAHRLLCLLNELMDFRKVESGALVLKVMPGNVGLFVKEIAEDFAELALQKNIHFTVKNNGFKEEAWFDRQVLEKIILNLLHNSFKYTAPGGKVSIEILSDLDNYQSSFLNKLSVPNSFKAKQTLFLKVADTGIGISGESIHHLFERFYRINEAHMGSGVGLAFVKSLTLLHKGSITVYSEAHQGSEFIISIPVHEADYTTGEKWLKPHQSQVRIESITSTTEIDNNHLSRLEAREENKVEDAYQILIVDDNEELRKFLKDALDANYSISEAVDGREGWQKIKEQQPDLVISDVMMPGIDGNELCRLVKEDIETSHIPFIMLTAKAALTSTLEGVGAGADHYFTKPLSVDLLQLTIKNVLEHRRRLKERFPKEYFSEAKELVHSAKDKEFMSQLLQIIESQLTNPELDVEMICREIGISRTKLYQKIKNLTGQSIGDFIRTIRLKRAAYIMTHEDVPLSDVMFRIGIQTQSYFTKAFKKEFGKTPTQFLQELKQ